MSVKDLKKKLNNILTKDESVVVSINGKSLTMIAFQNHQNIQ
jgi:hypothetical protein